MIKGNKGITLVALIITIIVLLILAVVTISAVNEGSLFAHANNAATAYSEKAEEENSIIADYLTKLKDHDGDNTKSSNSDDTRYNITFKDLSAIDWYSILEPNHMYALCFEYQDGTIGGLGVQTFDPEENTTIGRGYIPDITNTYNQYIYINDGDENNLYLWEHVGDYRDPSNTHIETLETLTVQNVRILTEEETAELCGDMWVPLSLEYESLIYDKTPVE